MNTRIFILLAALTASATAEAAQDSKVVAAKNEAVAAKAVKTQVNIPEIAQAIDPDHAYKANCARCHVSPRKLSERKMATVMRHMRVRANLTAEETDAILGYLTR